jgi:hypothetical protein
MKMAKTESKVPKGPYCYSLKEGKRVKCPYWFRNTDVHHQESGYCSLLETGDWMEPGTFLLWDQVKECMINEEVNEEEWSD